MKTPFYFTHIPSPIGQLTLVSSELGLVALHTESHTVPLAGLLLDDSRFTEVRRQLDAYFEGTLQKFDLPLDFEGMGGTPFQHQVWRALLDIPYGETVSYGEQARRIGNPKGVRAVGLTNGRNPISIIVPCHRVIGKNGTLTGYGGGLDRKRFLLDLEKKTLV